MMYSAYKLNKQGDNIQPWCTPFLIWNQSVVPCPVLTVASWPTYRFLKRQIRWSVIPISFRIFHSLFGQWSPNDNGACTRAWRLTSCLAPQDRFPGVSLLPPSALGPTQPPSLQPFPATTTALCSQWEPGCEYREGRGWVHLPHSIFGQGTVDSPRLAMPHHIQQVTRRGQALPYHQSSP